VLLRDIFRRWRSTRKPISDHVRKHVGIWFLKHAKAPAIDIFDQQRPGHSSPAESFIGIDLAKWRVASVPVPGANTGAG